MSDGPPSADATYVMPEAESVISFMVPLDADAIPKFLAKEAYRAYFDAMYDEYQLLGTIGDGRVELLERWNWNDFGYHRGEKRPRLQYA